MVQPTRDRVPIPGFASRSGSNCVQRATTQRVACCYCVQIVTIRAPSSKGDAAAVEWLIAGQPAVFRLAAVVFLAGAFAATLLAVAFVAAGFRVLPAEEVLALGFAARPARISFRN